jgi:hypothetical protein
MLWGDYLGVPSPLPHDDDDGDDYSRHHKHNDNGCQQTTNHSSNGDSTCIYMSNHSCETWLMDKHLPLSFGTEVVPSLPPDELVISTECITPWILMLS